MNSKAPLVMMEQIVMVLVFALAAALCLQTFVLSGKISKTTEMENRAAVEAQNVAETIKAKGLAAYIEKQQLQQTAEGFRLFLDEEWERVSGEEQAEYYVDICPKNSDSEFIWFVDIIIVKQDGTELIRIPAAGQVEVTLNE